MPYRVTAAWACDGLCCQIGRDTELQGDNPGGSRRQPIFDVKDDRCHHCLGIIQRSCTLALDAYAWRADAADNIEKLAEIAARRFIEALRYELAQEAARV